MAHDDRGLKAGRTVLVWPTCPPGRRCAGWPTRSFGACLGWTCTSTTWAAPGTPGTADGFERTFARNHLAPFLLTDLLLERLEDSAPARVVTVPSRAHTRGPMDFDDLQCERSHSGACACSQSKPANLLFTYGPARRLGGHRGDRRRGCTRTWCARRPGRKTPAASSDCSSRSSDPS